MTKNRPFVRKVIYFCIIAVLILPLSWLSRPSSSRSQGGVIARMRDDQGLSQASLGEIDPASAAMGLAALGMRGVAANQLWLYAIKCQKKENFDGVKTATDQIKKLQPNFFEVWRFQAHNLSYNISVQFDGYEHKYHWIKKGIDFLIDGTKYNRDEPGLTSDIGWFFGHKLSRADERVLFRELFRQDVDYHDKLNAETPVKTTSALGPDQRPDTWLMAHLWYSYAQKTADTKDVQVRGVAPLVFHSYPGKARIDYADAIESEGYLDEVGQEAWRKAGELWNEFGDRSIPNSRGYLIRLNDFEVFRSADRKYWEQLRELGPGVYEQLEAAKLAKLTEEERFIHETSNAELTDEQIGQRPAISRKLEITYEDLANHVPAENRVEAKKLASKARINSALASATSSYRDTINYVYWKIRCEAEQTDTMLAARKYVLEAERLYEETALTAARAEFERAWEKWAEVYEMYPDLRGDVEAEILLEKIVLYQELLGQLSEAFPPPDFKLTSFLEYNSFEYAELAREAFGSATPIGSNVGEVPPSTPDSGESPSASE